MDSKQTKAAMAHQCVAKMTQNQIVLIDSIDITRGVFLCEICEEYFGTPLLRFDFMNNQFLDVLAVVPIVREQVKPEESKDEPSTKQETDL